MNEYKLLGYFDSGVIYSGYLSPIFSNEDETKLFFQKISECGKYIVGFSGFIEKKSFTFNNFKLLENTNLKVKLGDECIIILKLRGTAYHNKFSEMLNFIFENDISKVIIDNSKIIFKDYIRNQAIDFITKK